MADTRLMRHFLLYVVLDVICVGAGMGVPAFAILLGLPVGWRLVRLLGLGDRPIADALAKVLVSAGITSAVTFAMMVVIWAQCIPMLFDPTANLAEFGIPLILFDPWTSFAGWLGLMIVVSPALQFLVTVLGANLALLREARRATRAVA